MAVTVDEARAALAGIRVEGGRLSDSNRLSGVSVAGGRVSAAIAIAPEEAAAMEPVRAAAEAALRALPGVEAAFVSLTAERAAPVLKPAAKPAPKPAAAAASPLAGVARVVAIASGKGGVGKSTTTCNLALALRARGLRVGVLDADIHGPSIPRLFGLRGQPRVLEGRILEPMDGWGVKVMSIGFLVEEEAAMVWRGPMIQSAIGQMLKEVAWGALDILLVDMPPGTGDAQLALAQQVPLTGAVIVSTPQDLALLDARRGVAMFRKVGVPILGVIENMAVYVCPTCGTAAHLFGEGGARAEASRIGVPFLGAAPLDMAIRVGADAGRPVAAVDPDGPQGRIYAALADSLLAALPKA
jgi:ATP-binding protein involved in chromosome partitioning